MFLAGDLNVLPPAMTNALHSCSSAPDMDL